MTLDLNLTEIELVIHLARDSRVQAARFTKARTTPVHDSVIAKCERALDASARSMMTYTPLKQKQGKTK